MPPLIDRALLRQVSADAVRVYAAVERAKAVDTEARAIVAVADDLLRQASIGFLLDGVEITPEIEAETGTATEAMVGSYLKLLHTYQQLHAALYRLAQAYVEAEEDERARVLLTALLQLVPDYPDAPRLIGQSYDRQVERLFGQGRADGALELMQERWKANRRDAESLRAYITRLTQLLRAFITDEDARATFGHLANKHLQFLATQSGSPELFSSILQQVQRCINPPSQSYWLVHGLSYFRQALSAFESAIPVVVRSICNPPMAD